MHTTLTSGPHGQRAARPPASLGDYVNLRRGGSRPASAAAFLGMSEIDQRRMERAFRGQVARGVGEAQPRYARHERHVAAVMAQGGFPALAERRVGRSGVRVGLPLTWPADVR